MPIAFKEWAVTVRALAEGEQLLTLRKGGIREPEKHFRLNYQRFFLYPTFDHQRTDLVRESHRPELSRALEEGVWSDGEPHPQALNRGETLNQHDRVRIRAWGEVAAHLKVTDRRDVCAVLLRDAGLRGEAPGLETAPPAARHPAADLSHSPPRHRQGARGV